MPFYSRYIAIVNPFFPLFRRDSRLTQVTTSVSRIRVKRHQKSSDSLPIPIQKVDTRRVSVYATAVCLFSSLYCVPMFFEYETCTDKSGHNQVCWSSLRRDNLYTLIYTLYIDIMFRITLPVILMAWSNYKWVYNAFLQPVKSRCYFFLQNLQTCKR